MGYDMRWRETPDWAAEEAAKENAKFDEAVRHRDALFTDQGVPPRRPWHREDDGSALGNIVYDEEPPGTEEKRKAILDSDEYRRRQEAIGWPDDPAYFRLNIWGMGTMRDIMEDLGLGYWAPHSDWPDSDAFGVDYDNDNYEESEAYQRYEAEADKVRAESPRPVPDAALPVLAGGKAESAGPVSRINGGGEVFGLPLHKFTSNDGWWVTPDDIRGALKVYRSLSQPKIDRVLKQHVEGDEKIEDVRAWLKRWMDWNEQAMLHGNGYEVW